MADKPKKGEYSPYVHALLEDAQELADAKVELLRKIGLNREGLRNQVANKYASPEQAKAVEEFYPTRERKTKGDK